MTRDLRTVTPGPASRWYLRSVGDGDTHLGQWQADGTVVTKCGLRFVLKACNYPGLEGEPPDPDQTCPACMGRLIVVRQR
jgi:hypothetical protein